MEILLKDSKDNYFLNALKRSNSAEYVPVWFLRQAGRYMPEYRAIRSKFSDFFEMIKQPEVCSQLTLQPLSRFPLDAAITFSDILTVPEALGMEIKFIEKRGPVFSNSIQKNGAINLELGQIKDKLDYVYQATEIIKSKIDIPLIGFAGSPWTIFTYMFYGESPKDFNLINSFILKNNKYVHAMLEIITTATTDYLNSQITSGADCVQIFDSWGGILDESYDEFSLQYINKIKESLPPDIPCILYSRGLKIKLYLENANIQCFNLDSSEKIEDYINLDIAVQGNLDPKIFHMTEYELEELAERIFESYKSHENYVCNLGSGITPDIDPNKVGVFLEKLRLLNSK